MAWGARQEDGAWRICERRGRTIKFVAPSTTKQVEIRFPGRARAEECAHKLNETFWEDYERYRKKHKATDVPFAWEMLDIIRDHGGISDADLEAVRAG
jgi:hypothetical protein